MNDRMVIVGGGLAGAKAAEALRARGFDGSVTLLAAEENLPYERPPLSKAYLMGSASFDEAIVHPEQWYRDNDVDLRQGVRAETLDLAGHVVATSDGRQLGYDKALLATGSAPRRLRLPGAQAAGVLTLRRRADADAIREVFGPDRTLLVIGAGWIGLEVAAAARQAGTEVTVVEVAELPLLAVLGEQVAAVFADLHRDHGVQLRLATQLAEIVVRDGRAAGVRLADGSEIAADAVVMGVGAAPEVTLAEAAGLAVDNGVLVDAALRTSDPDVFAAGDIANHDHPVLGSRIRVEHWASALNQPASAAAGMLGADAPYTDLPYFFTDQYDLGMEYIGNADPRQTRVVVRGDLGAREFVAFWLDREDRIRASMNVNVWDVVDQIKPLISAGSRVDAVRLADPGVDYAELV